MNEGFKELGSKEVKKVGDKGMQEQRFNLDGRIKINELADNDQGRGL